MVVLTGAAGIHAAPVAAADARSPRARTRPASPSGRQGELWYSSSCQEERGAVDS